MRFDIGTLDSGERSLPFGLLVPVKHAKYQNRHATLQQTVINLHNVMMLTLVSSLVWFDFCLTALQHILGHFGCGQLP